MGVLVVCFAEPTHVQRLGIVLMVGVSFGDAANLTCSADQLSSRHGRLHRLVSQVTFTVSCAIGSFVRTVVLGRASDAALPIWISMAGLVSFHCFPRRRSTKDFHMKHLIIIAAILGLAACGGGEIAVDIRTPTATEEDVLKCGIGAYFVPPAASSAGRGHCVAYPQLPAASAASAP